MMVAITLMTVTTPLYQCNARAAATKMDTSYIAETKLFIKKGCTIEDAKKWCENEGNGWKVLDGDLNSGAAGAFSDETGVFLCYRTTNDPDEAITDFAVMNEKGNYSEGDYELLLKEQREQYMDMVKNMKGMIDEYRTGYEKKVPMAVKAHDYLNAYQDDDSGQLLGDLLLNVEDDKLTDILLQANGIVVLTIEQQLASACDSAKTTWLDRMVKLGSYDKLKNTFSKNIKSGNVIKTMDAQYREKAQIILDNWDDVHERILNLADFETDHGLDGATEDEYNKWIQNMKLEDDSFLSYAEAMSLIALGGFNYDGKTLFDFFSKSKEQIEKEGIEILYPMVASMTEGQFCALEESVGLFELIKDAQAANIYNDYNAGSAGEIKKDINKDTKAVLDETVKGCDNILQEMTNGEKISIYDGVDRDVYNGGVAVTTEAKNASSGSESFWSRSLYKGAPPTILSVGMVAGTLTSAMLATGFSIAYSTIKWNAMNSFFKNANTEIYVFGSNLQIIESFQPEKMYGTLENLIKMSKSQHNELTKSALNQLKVEVMYRGPATKIKIFNGLKLGFTVFTVLLSVADISITAYSLYKYYHVNHLEIPHHMVNLSYGERQESSYVAYMSVRDQNGNCGDLNGGNCRQWLALYYTKDKNAGNPIIAPDNDDKMLVKTGNDSLPDMTYSPLHMFATPNVAQNLTFADGESGWSYNDKNKGTYLFFIHADAGVYYNEPSAGTAQTVQGKTSEAGTVVSKGILILIGAAGLVGGIFIGAITSNTIRRKKKLPQGSNK